MFGSDSGSADSMYGGGRARERDFCGDLRSDRAATDARLFHGDAPALAADLLGETGLYLNRYLYPPPVYQSSDAVE